MDKIQFGEGFGNDFSGGRKKGPWISFLNRHKKTQWKSGESWIHFVKRMGVEYRKTHVVKSKSKKKIHLRLKKKTGGGFGNDWSGGLKGDFPVRHPQGENPWIEFRKEMKGQKKTMAQLKKAYRDQFELTYKEPRKPKEAQEILQEIAPEMQATPQEAQAIVQALESPKVPYQLADVAEGMGGRSRRRKHKSKACGDGRHKTNPWIKFIRQHRNLQKANEPWISFIKRLAGHYRKI